MNLPSPQQLRYLVAVADSLHVGQAASECGISQPALSAQLTRLEQILGAQLVERTTRRVLLTPAGIEVAARARRVLTDLEELVAVAQHGQTLLAGSFFLGVIPTVAPYLLPSFLSLVRSEFPALRLFLREEQTSRLLEGLRQGKLDAVLLALPVAGLGIETRAHMLPRRTHRAMKTDRKSVYIAAEIGDEHFRLVVPTEHRLAGNDSVTHDDLAGEEVLLLEDGHCFRDQALAVCNLAGAHENSSIRANSISTLVQMVANGLGITLLPASAVAHELRGMTEVVDVAFSEPQPTRTLGLAWRSSSGRQEEFEALTELLSRSIANY